MTGKKVEKWITVNGNHVPIYEDSEDTIFKRDKWFDEAVYNRLPKKMQVKNIVSIGKERHGDDGTRYNASLKWEDGFNRSISEYGWTDFKDYLKVVLFEDREYSQ